MKTYEFFLGGDDAEMREIKKIAIAAGCIVHDKGLSWGAKVSDYKDHQFELRSRPTAVCGDPGIDTAAKAAMYKASINHRYVIVELKEDVRIGNNVISIDHHGDRSGEPPAIIQVCNLLGITPTREQCLIGAMDAGYAHGLLAIGATTEEIRKFLGASEGCLTVGEMLTEIADFPEEIILESKRAILESEEVGDCIIIRCNHNKSAPITARLIDRQENQNVLILSAWTEDGEQKTEANYYGNGETVRAINESLPGWTGGAGLLPPTESAKEYWTKYGGSVPDTAFWGVSDLPHGTVLKAVLSKTS